MDSVNKIEYKLRELSTRSVTLFPTRAQVQRDIKSVSLKPGTNEVTIFGLSPTVDQDSVKVEGGPEFTISDVSVESLPNREIFEDIYPDSDSDGSDDTDDDVDDLDDDRRWKEGVGLKEAKERLVALEDVARLADEAVESADARLKLLDAYGKALDKKRGVVIEDALETYKGQRSKAYADYLSGLKEQREATEKVDDQREQVSRLQRIDNKARDKARKEKEKKRRAREKELFKKARRQEERRKEKERIREEREKFWPKFCYAVRITLDTDVPTPMSSRRTSISTEVPASNPVSSEHVSAPAPSGEAVVQGHAMCCDLVLSYVTSSAHWAPSYDLQLSTTSSSGTLSFDAELFNSTSEAWNNTKIILSTSQATFSGLDDAIPTLNPWYMHLRNGAPLQGYNQCHELIARSADEVASMASHLAKQKLTGPQRPRSEMFGIDNQIQSLSSFQAKRSATKLGAIRQHRQMINHSLTAPCVPPPPSASLPRAGPAAGVSADYDEPRSAEAYAVGFGRGGDGGGGVFGSSAPLLARKSAAPGSARRLLASTELGEKMDSHGAVGNNGGQDEDEDEDDSAGSIMEETGFTSTYELPGLKTLVPKSAATKQRVAHIRFSNIAYSHTVVAKYKPVAYLEAKFKNTSKMTLFKGRAGLTLDGTFMGRTTLSRCSAGETITLSLGVDPAIKVTYPKPAIQRATTGLFSKENTAVFTRSVTLHNTRASAGKAISLLVLDQVPVSQDEKLRVEVLNPQGLSLGSGEVRAGAPGLDAKDNWEWGSAKASLKKNGEMNWQVALNPGKAVRLTLEYGIAHPNGTHPS